MPLLFDEDVSFFVTDAERYLFCQNGRELQVQIKARDLIPEGGALIEAIRTGTVQIRNVPEHIYGILFWSYAVL